MLLSAEQRQQIERRIAEVESKTSGEIVVRVVPTSGGYAWVAWAWAVIGIATASIGVGIVSMFSWPFSALQLLEWQLLGACVGIGLSFLAFFRRLLLSKRTLAEKVDRSAHAFFMKAGVLETRERTGILIYVSEFEHRVEILADKGVHSLLGKDYWQDQVRHIIDGIRAGKPGEAIAEAVSQMGEHLAKHFPRRAGDSNELPDNVRSD